jgi:hypothetical protein
MTISARGITNSVNRKCLIGKGLPKSVVGIYRAKAFIVNLKFNLHLTRHNDCI